MNNKVIMLKKDNNDVFFKYIKNKNIETYYKVKKENFLFRLARKFKLPLFYIFLGNWTKEIKRYQKIIMFDNGFNDMVAKYVKSKNKNIKTVLWYWNPISEYSKQFLSSPYVDEFWTYNRTDALQYGINYNTQFYTKEVKLEDKKQKNDIVFLGSAKQRKHKIVEIEEVLKKNNLKTNFKIVENKSDYISYDEYLKLIQDSKCVLDYNMYDLDALTLRPLEALFLKRKLITNNINIINYDFYNPKNIFILGKDDINYIKNFIDTEYEPVKEEIVDYYDYESWIKRFGV